MTTTRSRIPVTLLTGFLGSGKTSLLKRLIHQPGFARCAVIINEFGDVGLDQALVAESGDDRDIQLLDSGCLCCLANSAIQDTLASLYYRRLRKEIPWFDRILIETSGLAEPGPIINAIYGDSSLNHLFEVSNIITTFDTGFGEQDIEAYREAKLQIMMADTIVLTKTDLNDNREKLAAWLHDMHPSALILDNQQPDDKLAQTLGNPHAQPAQHTHFQSETPVIAPPNIALRHVLRYGITSITVTIDTPVSWPAWARFVHHVQNTFAGELLRFKGFLAFENTDTLMSVHAVHHLFSSPEPVLALPGSIAGTLIFIVRDTDRATVETAAALLIHDDITLN